MDAEMLKLLMGSQGGVQSPFAALPQAGAGGEAAPMGAAAPPPGMEGLNALDPKSPPGMLDRLQTSAMDPKNQSAALKQMGSSIGKSFTDQAGLPSGGGAPATGGKPNDPTQAIGQMAAGGRPMSGGLPGSGTGALGGPEAAAMPGKMANGMPQSPFAADPRKKIWGG